MEEKQLLMIPGPTPVPPSVLQAGAKPMINHRGPAFAKVLTDCTEGLKKAFKTKNDVIILTGSGTGGLEAAIVNTLSPGDQVLSVSIGVFGDRFASIAETYGAQVEKIEVEWGRAADPEMIAARLKQDTNHEIKAVLVTHNETSTGVTNDLEAIAGVIRKHGALILVDAISGLLAVDCETDKWGLDVVVAGSQKAFMIPPGLSFCTVSDKAWDAHQAAKMPRFYWDFTRAMKYFEDGQTPWTPAVPQCFALQEAFRILFDEGLDNCYKRHQQHRKAVHAGVAALGLNLFADSAHASPAVTAVRPPDGMGADEIRKICLNQHDVVLAGGQQTLKNKIFRIGHLGYVGPNDIIVALAAVGRALADLGVKVDPGAGAAAAIAAYAEDTR